MTEAEKFLRSHGESSSQVDLEDTIQAFTEELKLGLKGERSSLPTIPTYIGKIDEVKKNEKKILIDAGGTNFRSALGYFDASGSPVIERIEKCPMPATDGKALGRDEFYNEIADKIKYLLPVGGDIGFCFSYQVAMYPDIDGVVEFLSKEIKAPELLGTKVGACTLEAVKAYDDKQRKIAVLNDTVATLLGGMACNLDKKFSGYIGYIYGTGTNACYLERNSEIEKLQNLDLDGSMIINMESGNFDKFRQGDFDAVVAGRTDKPGAQLLEKISSGKYLADIIYMCLRGAAAEDLFANGANIGEFELKDVSDFLSGGENSIFDMFSSMRDRTTAKEICRELIDRAAKMGAVMCGATAAHVGEAKGDPVAIVAEGTTFDKLVGYRANFEKYLDVILNPRKIGYRIIRGKELNLVGTLMATMAIKNQ